MFLLLRVSALPVILALQAQFITIPALFPPLMVLVMAVHRITAKEPVMVTLLAERSKSDQREAMESFRWLDLQLQFLPLTGLGAVMYI